MFQAVTLTSIGKSPADDVKVILCAGANRAAVKAEALRIIANMRLAKTRAIAKNNLRIISD